MCAFGSVAALIVGDSVFQTLLLVLLLCKLLLNFFFLGIQLGKVFLFRQIVSAAKWAGIDAQASQGVQPLVRSNATQNSPDTQLSGR